MADHQGVGPRDPRVPAELFRSTTSPASLDLAAVLDGLERATRNLTEAAQPSSLESSFDDRMSEAEHEAREYLESAKRRADSLVNSMVSAVEHEAAEIRRGAEEGIRARWHQVEADASRHVENARRVAEQMVAERQDRIAALSDGINGRAIELTAGMDDAERVRGQFDAFVRALAVTADQIAKATAARGASGQLREWRDRPRPSAIAA